MLLSKCLKSNNIMLLSCKWPSVTVLFQYKSDNSWGFMFILKSVGSEHTCTSSNLIKVITVSQRFNNIQDREFGAIYFWYLYLRVPAGINTRVKYPGVQNRSSFSFWWFVNELCGKNDCTTFLSSSLSRKNSDITATQVCPEYTLTMLINNYRPTNAS